MRLGVRGKLLAGFGVVILFLVLIGGISVYGMRQVGDGLVQAAEVEMPGVIYVLEAQINAMQMQRDLRQNMLAENDADKGRARESYLAADRSYTEHLDALGKLLQSAEAKARLAPVPVR